MNKSRKHSTNTSAVEDKDSKSTVEILVAKFGLMGTIITSILALIGVTITAYFGFLGIRTQVELPTQITQTHEAYLTSIVLSSTPTIQSPTTAIPFETQSSTFTPVPELLQLTNGVGNNYQPSFSPDGNRIVFISTRDGNPEIYIMNLDGSQQVRLTNTPNIYEDVPSFSPDGSVIVFAGNDGTDDEIYLMNLDGSQIRNVSNAPDSNEGRPKLIPSIFTSLKVIFDSDRSGNWEIYVATLGISRLENITRITNRPDYTNRLPSYIPTTQQILFRSAKEVSLLYLINLDGTNLIQLSQLPNGKNDYYPTASTDGKWILFASDRDGNGEIYAMKLDGTYLKNITNNSAQDDTSAISPDDHWIVFSSTRTGGFYQLYRAPFTP